MRTTALLHKILEAGDLAAIQRLLEAVSIRGAQYGRLLRMLRTEARGNELLVWATLLLVARAAPEATAIGLHTYGRELNDRGEYPSSIGPLRVARIAYLWADDPDGVARAGATLA